MASSKESNLMRYRIGTKSSSFIILAFLSISTTVGSTKNPGRLIIFPPHRIFPY